MSDSKFARNRAEQKVINTLDEFNKVCKIIERYECNVKGLHYTDDLKVIAFDEIRGELYDFANRINGIRSNDNGRNGDD